MLIGSVTNVLGGKLVSWETYPFLALVSVVFFLVLEKLKNIDTSLHTLYILYVWSVGLMTAPRHAASTRQGCAA